MLSGGAELADELGRELPDLEAARRFALKAVGEIVADEMALGRERVRITIFVHGEDGGRLLELPVMVTAGD
jgi:hypothetical protein